GMLVGLSIWAVSLPGPLVGIGLKDFISAILDSIHVPIVGKLLYYGPSYAPLGWIYGVRFFPIAFLFASVGVRSIPRSLREGALLDGMRPFQQLRWLVFPFLFPIFVQSSLIVAMLALGEISAGKLVETPGAQTAAHEIFNLMHYGVANDLAALGLIVL